MVGDKFMNRMSPPPLTVHLNVVCPGKPWFGQSHWLTLPLLHSPPHPFLRGPRRGWATSSVSSPLVLQSTPSFTEGLTCPCCSGPHSKWGRGFALLPPLSLSKSLLILNGKQGTRFVHSLGGLYKRRWLIC